MIDSGQENWFKIILDDLFFQKKKKKYMNFYIHVTRDHKSRYLSKTLVEAQVVSYRKEWKYFLQDSEIFWRNYL